MAVLRPDGPEPTRRLDRTAARRIRIGYDAEYFGHVSDP